MPKKLVVPTIVLILVTLIPVIILTPRLLPLFGAGPKKLETKIISFIKVISQKEIHQLNGAKEINITMDDSELTNRINESKENSLVKDIQIKINADGIIESSGTLIISKVIPYAITLGYSEEQIKEAMNNYDIPSSETSFYIKGTGGVRNNKVTIKVSVVKIGEAMIPSGIVFQASREVKSTLENLIQKHNNSINIENINLNDNKIQLKGQLTEKAYSLIE